MEIRGILFIAVNDGCVALALSPKKQAALIRTLVSAGIAHHLDGTSPVMVDTEDYSGMVTCIRTAISVNFASRPALVERLNSEIDLEK